MSNQNNNSEEAMNELHAHLSMLASLALNVKLLQVLTNQALGLENPANKKTQSKSKPEDGEPKDEKLQFLLNLLKDNGNALVLDIKKIIVQTIDGKEHPLMMRDRTTGIEIMKFIYDRLCQELKVDCMALYYGERKIGKAMKLSDINFKENDKIVQQKISLTDVVGDLQVDHNGQDEISLEKGVVKMSCGHQMGRNSMTELVRSLAKSGLYQIRCPHAKSAQNSQKCNALWDYSICRKIGIFTKNEMIQFEEGLSRNWIKQFSKECPKCKDCITRFGQKSNKIRCKCGYGYFCYDCLELWKSSNNKQCGSDACSFRINFIKDCKEVRVFSFKNKQENTDQNVSTPKYRVCPHCQSIIENYVNCKHTTCKSCNQKFCWVCLSVPKNGVWPCKGPFDKCEKVAPVQDIQSKSP